MSDRTEKLRLHVLNTEPTQCAREDEYHFFQGWIKYANGNDILRYGLAKGYELSENTPVIDDGEIIVGKQNNRQFSPEEQADYERVMKEVRDVIPRHEGQESHMAIDFDKLLEKGLYGIRDEINGYRGDLDLSVPEDQDRDYFYQACLAALDGLEALSLKYSRLASEMAESENDPVRKKELIRISEITAKVPMHPASSFYEACQSVNFVNSQLEGLYQLGRPDRYLYRYYRSDIDSGVITREEALELVSCLSIMMNEYMSKGLAVGLMVGGRDGDGKDVTNELTYLFVEAIENTRLAYPGVGVCVDSDTPDELIELSCRMLGKGYSHPAIFNDEVITRGLMEYGLPREHACIYTHSTCVEITPVKRSAVWVASPYHNLTGYLLEVMENKDADTLCPDFDSLLSEYRKVLAAHIRYSCIEQNSMMLQRNRAYANPLLSCFVDDCLSKGCDIERGGAIYNWIMPSFVGVSNLVDSLVSIKKLVYEEKELTLSSFYDILKNNYEGNEVLHSKICRGFEKYGNDCSEPDSLVSVINGFILEEVGKYRNPRGGGFIPSLFCWVMHEYFGRETMATPDGRLSGFPFGDGSGPAQGRERKGPTCAINSTTKWDHHRFIGGIAMNLRFSKSMFSENSLPKMKALIKTYLERGGFELQINVVDRDTMIEAQKHPEDYSDLIVRIGGYSDYFTRVGKNMQDELILRSEFEI